MTIELIAFTSRGRVLARKLADQLISCGHRAACSRQEGQTAAEWARQAFGRAQALVFVGAAGIAVRSIAPIVHSKAVDPAVVVVDERGQFAIPVLSGHLGGANDLAREIAALLGGQAVITTATDVNGVFGVDQWARRQGLVVCRPEQIVDVSSALLEGKQISVWSRWPIEGAMPLGMVWGRRESAEVVIDWSCPGVDERRCEKFPCGGPLWLCPRTLRLGIGCKRGTTATDIQALAERLTAQEGVPLQAVEAVCSIDLKREEPGLLAFCRDIGRPLTIYTAWELSQVPGNFSVSSFVQSVTGVDNVCERAALAAGGRLLRGKITGNGVTAALAGREPKLDWRT